MSVKPTNDAPALSRRAARAAELARAERRRRTGKIAVIIAGVAIVGVVATLAFTMGGNSSSTDASGQSYVATKDGFRLPGLIDPKDTVALSDFAGTPVVVNFFASWCVYCNEELPGFVQVATATSGKVAFVGIDTNDSGDGVAMAKRFDLQSVGFHLAHDIGNDPASDLWLSYGSQGLPVTAFYDASGKLVDFSGGMLTQSELQDRIKKNFGIDVQAADATQLGAPVIPLIPRGAYELLNAHHNPESYFAIDLRPAAQYAKGRITGARNLAEATPASIVTAAAGLSKDGSYFLYDATGTQAEAVSQALHAAGFKHLYFIEGGFQAWTAAGGPTEH